MREFESKRLMLKQIKQQVYGYNVPNFIQLQTISPLVHALSLSLFLCVCFVVVFENWSNKITVGTFDRLLNFFPGIFSACQLIITGKIPEITG